MAIRKIEGVVHWAEDLWLVRSIGRRLEQSHDNGQTFETVAYLDFGPLRNLATKHRLSRRLMRAQVKLVLPLQNREQLLVIACKQIFKVNCKLRSSLCLGRVVGSHPLRICRCGRKIFYGEYRSNAERSPVHIWGSEDEGKNWEPVFQFNNVRHIHGVFFDPYESCFWVTTGDNDCEAAIWKIDLNWQTAEMVHHGSQQSRIIDLLFSSDRIYFGTDAPHEQNWICCMERKGYQIRQITPTNGTVFHARQHGETFLFTTACEPGVSSLDKRVDLLSLKHGVVEKVLELRKDLWSMKYFQYGQIMFAAGDGKKDGFWISPIATNFDQRSLWIENVTESSCST